MPVRGRLTWWGSWTSRCGWLCGAGRLLKLHDWSLQRPPGPNPPTAPSQRAPRQRPRHARRHRAGQALGVLGAAHARRRVAAAGARPADPRRAAARGGGATRGGRRPQLLRKVSKGWCNGSSGGSSNGSSRRRLLRVWHGVQLTHTLLGSSPRPPTQVGRRRRRDLPGAQNLHPGGAGRAAGP
jgi:hypothetical protein